MHASMHSSLACNISRSPPMFLISKLRGRIAQLKLLLPLLPQPLTPLTNPSFPIPRSFHTVECVREIARKKKPRGTMNPIAGIGNPEYNLDYVSDTLHRT